MRSLLLLGLAACSAPSVNVQNNVVAADQQKSTANMVKSFASTTPPSGATSMGMQSNPQAGRTAIPITNVEVYVFSANINSDPAPETLYWAYDGTVAYVWGAFDLECVDDSGSATGETGSADFIYTADASGYGWMVSTESCGYSTLYGCSDDDGGGETCGGCDWNDSFVACTAQSS
jgi:hypothetical protein